MADHWNANAVRVAMAAFMKQRQLNVHSWSRQAKISHNTLRNFLRKKTNSMTHETLSKLAHAVGASIVEITGSASDEARVHQFPSTISATGRLTDRERDLLEEVITQLDGLLDGGKHTLPPTKRAKVIVYIFEEAMTRLYRDKDPTDPGAFDITEYGNVIKLALPDNNNGRAA